MAESRMIRTAFWDDEYVSELEPIERYLFLYFLTNPKTHICGVYQIRMKQIIMDTSLDIDFITPTLKKFEEAGKMKYKDGWIAIRNWIKHQKTGSKLLEAGILRGLKSVPSWCVDYIQYAVPVVEEEQEEYQEEKEEKGEENVEITNVLNFIKSTLIIKEFKEPSKKQRLRGKHLLDLQNKIGEENFKKSVRKLLVKGGQKGVELNSLDVIYAELKCYENGDQKKAIVKEKKTIDERDYKQLEEKEKAASKKEQVELFAYFETLTKEEKEELETEAKAALFSRGIIEENEKAKGRGNIYENILKGALLGEIRKHKNNPK